MDGIEKFVLFQYDECPLFPNTQDILFFLALYELFLKVTVDFAC